MVTTSVPCPASLARMSGWRMILISSLFRRFRMAGGVPLATSMPCQVPDSNPVSPCSASVGTLPISGMRLPFETPRIFNLPLCTNGSVASMPFIKIWVCPAIVSVIACEPPLYGMYCQLAPLARSTATPARCGALPIAVTAKFSSVFFDSATSSLRLLARTDGCTTSRCGEYASMVTPRKSLTGSNGSLVYTDGLMASAPVSHSSSV